MAGNQPLRNIKACVFDAYGTLFPDVEIKTLSELSELLVG